MKNQQGNLILYVGAIVLIALIVGAAWFVKMRLPAKTSVVNTAVDSTLPLPTSQSAGAVNNASTSAQTDVNVEDDFKGVDADLQAL